MVSPRQHQPAGGRWLPSIDERHGRRATVTRVRPDGTRAGVLARGTSADWAR